MSLQTSCALDLISADLRFLHIDKQSNETIVRKMVVICRDGSGCSTILSMLGMSNGAFVEVCGGGDGMEWSEVCLFVQEC